MAIELTFLVIICSMALSMMEPASDRSRSGMSGVAVIGASKAVILAMWDMSGRIAGLKIYAAGSDTEF
jgi:L-alanine-DL-glutamate epimerase-like enolase superfamily enzyme